MLLSIRGVGVCAVICLHGGFVLAQAQTNWTGAAGNLLWSDAGNWSAGIPDQSTSANVLMSGGPIDLGGGSWSAYRLQMEGDGIQIVNGTLAASFMDYSHNSPWVPAVISASVTGINGELHAMGSGPKPWSLAGPVTGDTILGLWGSVRLTAPADHTRDTVIGNYGYSYIADAGAIRNSPALHVRGPLVLDNVATVINGRLNSSASVDISDGSLSVHMAPGTTASERVGATHFSGYGSINLGTGSAGFTLSSPSLTRDRGTMLTLITDPAAGHRMLLDTPPAMVGAGTTSHSRPIIPSAGQITYDIGNDPLNSSDDVGIRALADSELASIMPAAGATAPPPNARLSSAQTITGNVVVNSLSGSRVTLENANLRIESGYLDAPVDGSGTITAPDELYLPLHRYLDMTVPVLAKSLIISGGGRVRLASANELSDLISVQAARLDIDNPAATGTAKLRYSNTDTSTLSVNDTMTLPNDIQLGLRNQQHPSNVISYGPPIDVSVPRDKTLTLNGSLTGETVGINGINGRLRLNGNASFDHVIFSGFQGIEVNGELRGKEIAPGFHDANIQRTSLTGSGTILGIFSSGAISPGPEGGVGRLVIENLGPEFTYHCDITGLGAGESYDQLMLLYRIFPQGMNSSPPILDLDLTFAPALGSQFLILDNGGGELYSDLFAGLPEGSAIMANGAALRISYLGGDGNDVVLTTVPEPASAMAISGTAALLLGRRQHRPRPKAKFILGAWRESAE